jgi:hypothetical protein
LRQRETNIRFTSRHSALRRYAAPDFGTDKPLILRTIVRNSGYTNADRLAGAVDAPHLEHIANARAPSAMAVRHRYNQRPFASPLLLAS